MSDEPPKAADFLSSRFSRGYQAYPIGEKCVVVVLDDGWICACGARLLPDREIRECKPDKRRTSGRANPARSIDPADRIAPDWSTGMRDAESVIYFNPGRGEDDGEALIVTPRNLPFRAFAKGCKRGASMSFDENGNPVPEILLLYALKTGSAVERLSALTALPLQVLAEILPGNNIGEGMDLTVLRQMAYAPSDRAYREIVGRMMARDASSQGGLACWATWESVADRAVEEAKARAEKYRGDGTPDFDALFLLAVGDMTIEHRGLPALNHVRKRWEELGGKGDWEDNKKKLGFAWLPSENEWDKWWGGAKRDIYID